MDKEVGLAILGLLTAVAGAARWLISVYWKQAETIEDLRHRNEKRTILTMREAIDDLKKEIALHKNSLKTMHEKLDYIHKRLDQSADETSKTIQNVNEMIDKLVDKITVMETQVVSLAKGLLLIRNKVNGQQDNK